MPLSEVAPLLTGRSAKHIQHARERLPVSPLRAGRHGHGGSPHGGRRRLCCAGRGRRQPRRALGAQGALQRGAARVELGGRVEERALVVLGRGRPDLLLLLQAQHTGGGICKHHLQAAVSKSVFWRACCMPWMCYGTNSWACGMMYTLLRRQVVSGP